MNKNLANLMQEAQKMQKRMEEAQKQLSELVVPGESGGGMVKVQMNGRHYLLDLKINPSLMTDDVDDIAMIEDLVKAAVNNAVNKVGEASQEKLSKITSGLSVPPEFLKKDEGEE